MKGTANDGNMSNSLANLPTNILDSVCCVSNLTTCGFDGVFDEVSYRLERVEPESNFAADKNYIVFTMKDGDWLSTETYYVIIGVHWVNPLFRGILTRQQLFAV